MTVYNVNIIFLKRCFYIISYEVKTVYNLDFFHILRLITRQGDKRIDTSADFNLFTVIDKYKLTAVNIIIRSCTFRYAFNLCKSLIRRTLCHRQSCQKSCNTATVFGSGINLCTDFYIIGCEVYNTLIIRRIRKYGFKCLFRISLCNNPIRNIFFVIGKRRYCKVIPLFIL